MSDRANATARQWQMTKLAAGAYLLPSNDRATLFLIARYTEDGTAENDRGPITGTYWEASAMDWGQVEHEHAIDPDPYSWEGWEPIVNMQPTRRDAIDYCLTWSTTR